MLTKFEVQFLKRCKKAELVVNRPDVSCVIMITQKRGKPAASLLSQTVKREQSKRQKLVEDEINRLLAA